MKNRNTIIAIIAGVVALAAVITAIIVFRKQIAAFFDGLKEKFAKKEAVPEDYVDFADV